VPTDSASSSKAGKLISLRSLLSQGLAPIVGALAVALVPAHPACANSLSPEEQAVVAPLQAFFTGIAKRDKAAMSAQVLPDTHATIIRGGKILQLSMKELLERMPPGTSTLAERFWDPLVRIDDDIALIWTPYDFLMDGKVHHCGTDVVNLVRLDGRWVIAGLADNSRTNCSRK